MCEFFQSECTLEPLLLSPFSAASSAQMGLASPPSARRQLYAAPMSKLRLLMVQFLQLSFRLPLELSLLAIRLSVRVEGG